MAHVSRDAVAEFQTFLSTESGSAAAGLSSAACALPGAVPAGNPTGGNTGDKERVPTLLKLAGAVPTLDSAQHRAAADLLAYDGEVYPQDGCANRPACADMVLKIGLGELTEDAKILALSRCAV